MPVDVQCPECGETLELSKRPAIGKKIRCPECEESFAYKEKPAKSASSGAKKKKSKDKAGPNKTKKGSAFPIWLPFVGGIGAFALLAVGIVIYAIATRGGDKKPTEVADQPAPPANPKVVPPGGTRGPIPPGFPGTSFPPVPPGTTGGPIFPPIPDPIPDPDPEPPRRPRIPDRNEMPVRLEMPPLPPANERPVLVLDPGTHTAAVRAVSFFPDGKRFATFSMDKTIRIWDTEAGITTKLITLPNGPGKEGAIMAGAVSPDGKWLAATGIPFGLGKNGILVYLISVASGEVERTFTGHVNPVNGVSFSKDSQLLVTGSADGTANVIKIATGETLATLKGHTDIINQAKFHPKDNRVATCSKDGTIRIWTPGIGGKTYTSVSFAGNKSDTNDIAWSPDGTTLATGATDGTIRTWTTAGKPIKTYEKQDTKEGQQALAPVQIVRLAYTRDGKEIAYGGVAYIGHAGILNLASGERRVDRVGAHDNTVLACATSPTQDLAITCGGDSNDIHIWNTKDGNATHKIVCGNKSVWAVAASHEGDLLYGTINRGNSLPLSRKLEAGFRLEKLDFVKVPERRIASQARFGEYTAAQTDFFTVEVKKNGQPHYSFALQERAGERIYSATLFVGDKLLVGTSARLVMIDLKTKQQEKTYIGHFGTVTTIAPMEQGMFLTGSDDQTLRMWHPDRTEPVLSMFFVGREWIAWTPEGYYAASPAGERLMGWQVNNGPNKTGAFYPAIQFRRTLLQPEVIRNLVKAKGDLGMAVALAIRDTGRPVPSVNLSQVLPPMVAITSPVNTGLDVNSDKEVLEVSAKAQSVGKNPVKSLRLLVDGRPYQGKKGVQTIANPKLGEVNVKWNVNLTPGRHTIHVLAENGVSQSISNPTEIVQAGEPLKPSLYVLAIGVNEYTGKMRLNYATPDAKAISSVLQRKSGGVFDKVEVKLITDRQATKAEILKGLEWMNSVVTPKDVGIFYFSGHGMQDDEGSFYLVPVDVNPRRPTQTCLHGNAVKDKLSEMPGKVVAIFDACHSGAAAESMQSGGAGGLVQELLTDDCGIIVLCSSMGDEVSLESSETKAGFFTHGFVEGLEGKADFNQDGYVFIHEAMLFASIRVQQLSRGEQNPTLGRPPHMPPFALTKP